MFFMFKALKNGNCITKITQKVDQKKRERDFKKGAESHKIRCKINYEFTSEKKKLEDLFS